MDVLTKWLLLTLFPVLICCNNKDGFNNTKQVQSGKAFVDLLNKSMGELSSLHSRGSEDSIAQLNETIRVFIEKVNSPKLLQEIDRSYKSKKQHFSFTMSNDGKLAVFTWNTYSNSSASGHRNIALYLKNQKVIPTSLYNGSVIYDQIYTVQSIKGNRPIYILHGHETSKEGEKQIRLDAYSIKKDGIELEKVFPDRRESITLLSTNVNYPLNLADFKIEKKGEQIKVPQLTDSIGKYRLIKFDGIKYSQVSLQDLN